MCKLARNSLYCTITKFSFFSVLELWLIYDCETDCSFVYFMMIIMVMVVVVN